MKEHFQVVYTGTVNRYLEGLEEAIEVPETVIVGGADSYNLAIEIVKETLEGYPKMQLSIRKLFVKE